MCFVLESDSKLDKDVLEFDHLKEDGSGRNTRTTYPSLEQQLARQISDVPESTSSNDETVKSTVNVESKEQIDNTASTGSGGDGMATSASHDKQHSPSSKVRFC